jgi:hypothetical protein
MAMVLPREQAVPWVKPPANHAVLFTSLKIMYQRASGEFVSSILLGLEGRLIPRTETCINHSQIISKLFNAPKPYVGMHNEHGKITFKQSDLTNELQSAKLGMQDFQLIKVETFGIPGNYCNNMRQQKVAVLHPENWTSTLQPIDGC